MFNFDSTIHLSDLLIFGGGIYTIGKLAIHQRDINRDVLRMLGKDRPKQERYGLLGDVEALKEDVGDIKHKMDHGVSWSR